MKCAARLTITGVVQGVGFRPFVQRLATEYELAGWVRNESGQVELLVEGEPPVLDAFAAALPLRIPTLARIDSMRETRSEAHGAQDFRIVASYSDAATPARLPVPADVVLCDACAEEVANPTNRRYQYPFTTCTDCGPRYTVIDALPYDRERTSLREFPLCADCAAEYASPDDRRFHAESIACPVCGPHLSYELMDGTAVAAGDDRGALQAAADTLRDGGIVALRGMGGFHLAVDATNEEAVTRLRQRKHRAAKPLACMVRSLSAAETMVSLTDVERAWLTSRERPIVLASTRRADDDGAYCGLAPAIAPGLDRVGIMLPSTPLHLLLLDLVDRPLVMTSGNLSDEPLAASNDEARTRLVGIADALLTHDREIVAPLDDSVVRVAGTRPIVIRRARGYAPLPNAVPVASPVPLLAAGAHLKNTFTLLHDARAYVSPHIGDLDSLEALAHWRSMRARYETLFHVTPAAVIADCHDGYLSTTVAQSIAEANPDVPLMRVQHHHAHIAAVAAEHGVTEPVLGLALDGNGAGTDGTVWGFEFLLSDLTGFTRVGRLRPFALPGGDAAARAPWRSLAGLHALDVTRTVSSPRLPGVSEREQDVVRQLIERAVNTPMTSSAGRLFDAVASLLGLCHVAQFEGEAAMRLEACAGDIAGETLPFSVVATGYGGHWLDPLPLLAELSNRKARGVPVAQLAADFHESLVRGAATLAIELAHAYRLDTVALGGGCFQNARLLTQLSSVLSGCGLRVLTANALPVNDGGLSYGQAAIGAACFAAGLSAPMMNDLHVARSDNGRLAVTSH